MYENVILIPYRDRETHLEQFIALCQENIRKYMPRTKIVIIEQENGKPFNRGKLLNIGFELFKNKTNFFLTHDVDHIPSQQQIMELYTNESLDILRIKSAHNQSLGGIVKFTHDSVYKMNGFPNYIWGWGIEDRALYYRSVLREINITDLRKSESNAIKSLHHKSNAHVYTGEKKKISDIWTREYIETLSPEEREFLVTSSGLSDLDYVIVESVKISDDIKKYKVSI